MIETDLECFRGDTASWTVTVTKNGAPEDLTGASLSFAVRRNWASPVLFERTNAPGGGIVVTSPATNGVAVITMRRDDTLGLTNQETTLVYSVRVTTATGEERVVAWGNLQMHPEANV